MALITGVGGSANNFFFPQMRHLFEGAALSQG